MILRCHQRCYAFAITYYEEREFVALQEFFQHHAGAGFAQHLAAEHLAGYGGGFVFGLRDDYAFSGS